jgi:hypothetical protein
MRKKKQRKNIYVWKKYNISMCKNKIKWSHRFSKVHWDFQGFMI